MSNPSPLSNESIGPSGPESDRQHEQRLRRLVRSVKGPTQFLSFWVAIALPFVHLPLLAQGLGDPQITVTFLLLLAVNVCALYVGHGYGQ
ncbi:hypothetical protein Htur_0106 [Haloterrigena turkmenica DSM 5511]|uniref:Uncharacterized protein n=1 Tax=Haloterrigena turkmenica (strain ATCC 51198 / DSM 5511 / JCM 9101 / NCIMB 13204 / VKM B-1734 / 4k) TaxID=543526 RepID=D2RTG4_HALTV|nr:hypothetical protein [Haloterrigena turkmenica]ADB59007.1 hypothetical protein Htur_0106 [Haloterrigena turkmenica DSM 5511]